MENGNRFLSTTLFIDLSLIVRAGSVGVRVRRIIILCIVQGAHDLYRIGGVGRYRIGCWCHCRPRIVNNISRIIITSMVRILVDFWCLWNWVGRTGSPRCIDPVRNWGDTAGRCIKNWSNVGFIQISHWTFNALISQFDTGRLYFLFGDAGILVGILPFFLGWQVFVWTDVITAVPPGSAQRRKIFLLRDPVPPPLGHRTTHDCNR